MVSFTIWEIPTAPNTEPREQALPGAGSLDPNIRMNINALTRIVT
jgi:hypothetical protein